MSAVIAFGVFCAIWLVIAVAAANEHVGALIMIGASDPNECDGDDL